MTFRVAVGVLGLACSLLAQRRVDSKNTYERIICVVPMTGSGTYADPMRPLYAPTSISKTGDGIIAFSHVVSDDGKYAIVEFVARNRAAFQTILADKKITVIEKRYPAPGVANGNASANAEANAANRKADIELNLKKYRKDFDLNRFGTVLP